jgi:hypothetical protein
VIDFETSGTVDKIGLLGVAGLFVGVGPLGFDADGVTGALAAVLEAGVEDAGEDGDAAGFNASEVGVAAASDSMVMPGGGTISDGRGPTQLVDQLDIFQPIKE